MTAEARGTTLAFRFLDIEILRDELWGWTGYVPSDAILSQTPQLQAGQAGTGPPPRMAPRRYQNPGRREYKGAVQLLKAQLSFSTPIFSSFGSLRKHLSMQLSAHYPPLIIKGMEKA